MLFSELQVSRLNWDSDGVCEIAFQEEDEEALRNASVFTRRIRPYEYQCQNVYNFYTLNKRKKKPYHLNEETFLSSVFGTDEENVTISDASSKEMGAENEVQSFSFGNVFPGDYIALRVEDGIDIKLTNYEKWMLHQKRLKEESYVPKRWRLSFIGTTLESACRVEPK